MGAGSADWIRPERPWRSRSLSGLPLRADGQLLAALCASARKNGAAIGRLHAFAKTVHLGAATIVRLKSTFRHCIWGKYKYTRVLGLAGFQDRGSVAYTEFMKKKCSAGTVLSQKKGSTVRPQSPRSPKA